VNEDRSMKVPYDRLRGLDIEAISSLSGSASEAFRPTELIDDIVLVLFPLFSPAGVSRP
jgi:hypothetical protein